MKKGYWVVVYRSVSDEAALKAYGALAVPAIDSFGGSILIEYDSYDIAVAAHESEAYKKALQALGHGAERDFRIVEGV